MDDCKIKKPAANGKQFRTKYVVLIVIAAVLLALIIAAVCTAVAYDAEISAKGRTDVKAVFTVPAGSTFASLGDSLRESGFIGNGLAYKVYLKLNPPADSLKAGSFELSPAMSYAEIITVLSGNPIPQVYSFTIAEGKTQKEILDAMAADTGYTAEQLTAALDAVREDYSFLKELPDREYYYEGYLYPDTYEVYNNATAEDIVRKPLDNFAAKLEAGGITVLLSGNRFTLDEAVTLASIVQCEAANVSEMADIAGVFTKRLDINMELGSCVTVFYLLGRHGGYLSNEDIKIDSPYNTYIYKGLTPGPIASFRIEALVAALAPADNDYYYFIGTGDKTIFAKTYKEHQENCDKYLK